MSKALEAARKAIEAHPAYDCGSTGDEEMARAAITAYLAHLVEDAQGPPSVPEIMMREAIWVELGPALFDTPVEQVNRAVRAAYVAAVRSLSLERNRP